MFNEEPAIPTPEETNNFSLRVKECFAKHDKTLESLKDTEIDFYTPVLDPFEMKISHLVLTRICSHGWKLTHWSTAWLGQTLWGHPVFEKE